MSNVAITDKINKLISQQGVQKTWDQFEAALASIEKTIFSPFSAEEMPKTGPDLKEALGLFTTPKQLEKALEEAFESEIEAKLSQLSYVHPNNAKLQQKAAKPQAEARQTQGQAPTQSGTPAHPAMKNQSGMPATINPKFANPTNSSKDAVSKDQKELTYQYELKKKLALAMRPKLKSAPRPSPMPGAAPAKLRPAGHK